MYVIYIYVCVCVCIYIYIWGFPGGSVVEPTASAGDASSIPGSGRSPGGGNDNSLQYSCLKIPIDRGSWQATVHGVTKRVGHNSATEQQQYICVYRYMYIERI